MTRKLMRYCIGMAAVLLVTVPLRASDPVGIYGLIDKVVLEPNDARPTAAQIWGAFSLAIRRGNNGVQSKPEGSFGNANAGDVYGAVQKGYLYVRCPQGKESLCRNEWSDLKAAATRKDVVGFGSRWENTPLTVRKATDAPALPDVYAMNVGVVKIAEWTGVDNRTQYPDLIAALQAASRSK